MKYICIVCLFLFLTTHVRAQSVPTEEEKLIIKSDFSLFYEHEREDPIIDSLFVLVKFILDNAKSLDIITNPNINRQLTFTILSVTKLNGQNFFSRREYILFEKDNLIIFVSSFPEALELRLSSEEKKVLVKSILFTLNQNLQIIKK